MPNTPRQFAKSVLDKLHVYRPVRSLYRQTFGQEIANTEATLRQFYTQFIAPGDLVFDIGANVGLYAEAFQSLGAKVVAVEPNPDCVVEIKRNTARESVMVVQAAVSDHVGQGMLMLPDRASWGSMSAEWIERAQSSQRFRGASWSRQIAVPTTTIEKLQKDYGRPRFIKVDVEGYEVKVLDGMSEQPEFLSFEFNTENMGMVSQCLDRLSPNSSFNFVMGAPPARLELAEWVNRKEIEGILGKITVLYFGDVMVKAPSKPAL